MKVLVINAGSSSLKYQLVDMDNEKVLGKGIVERIGIEGSNLVHKYEDKKHKVEQPLKDHKEAIALVLDTLTKGEHRVIDSMDEIGAFGHRVVHGGEEFAASVVIDDKVIAAIEANIPLAPLHNPANLMGIAACQHVMPNTPNVAVFDTAFHQTMPRAAYMYGLPYDYYERLKVRRYGFHGTSHRYVADQCAKLLGKPAAQTKIITCHLGNGSSLCAVSGGKSVDTSMGMTPLEGILMGSRSGSIDPAILQYVMHQDNLTIDQMTSILNKQSGMMGLDGLTSDMRDMMDGILRGDDRCKMAFEVWRHSVQKYIGGYAAIMGGLDAIVFTAGIGENDDIARNAVCEGLEFLGVEIDPAKNKGVRGQLKELSKDGSKVKVFLIPTDEEMAIARDTKELVDE